jgi:hypothetical protein
MQRMGLLVVVFNYIFKMIKSGLWSSLNCFWPLLGLFINKFLKILDANIHEGPILAPPPLQLAFLLVVIMKSHLSPTLFRTWCFSSCRDSLGQLGSNEVNVSFVCPPPSSLSSLPLSLHRLWNSSLCLLANLITILLINERNPTLIPRGRMEYTGHLLYTVRPAHLRGLVGGKHSLASPTRREKVN